MSDFRNEPLLELRRGDVRERLGGALAELDARLPLDVPVIVGDSGRATGARFESRDPGEPSRTVASAVCGRRADAEDAARAARADATWRSTSAGARAAALAAAAAELRERRYELAALQVRECAKPWIEADADVCEAIDQLEYAARDAGRIGAGRALAQVRGERNAMRYDARGVVAVIAPWNFPLAIPAGMTAAALAGGNAVVLKPAEQAPASALALVAALRAGGVPAAAIALVPGFAEAGAALVESALVDAVAFTGSSAVGLEIIRKAASVPPGQRHVKHVVAEMGGKNCVIVDADADLDEAVPAIVHSAFDYAGQKCSAAARVLAHRGIAPALRERLEGAVRALAVGPAAAFETDVPPLIERDAQSRVCRYLELAEASGHVVKSPALPAGGGQGWYVPAAVVSGLPVDSEVLHDEIFGPLLALEEVSDVDAACDLVEASPFALTGGLFSRNVETIDRVVARSPVGNLYVNRAITSAKVGRQPFGGRRLSGVGAKLGGPDYAFEFVESRVISENTMRHGLIVEQRHPQ